MYKPCHFSVAPWAEKENLLQRKDIFKVKRNQTPKHIQNLQATYIKLF